jgi:hypothetical protein
MSEKIGWTGEFPEGKCNEHDEGKIQIAVHSDTHNVILEFGALISWMGLPPGTARELAGCLLTHADAVEGIPYPRDRCAHCGDLVHYRCRDECGLDEGSEGPTDD